MAINCTYDDCPKTFKTGDAMVKHKVKDPVHSYCKKCDVDCKDDLEYLIHQIESSNHGELALESNLLISRLPVACPICGREFQSKSGRDSHVELVRYSTYQDDGTDIAPESPA